MYILWTEVEAARQCRVKTQPPLRQCAAPASEAELRGIDIEFHTIFWHQEKPQNVIETRRSTNSTLLNARKVFWRKLYGARQRRVNNTVTAASMRGKPKPTKTPLASQPTLLIVPSVSSSRRTRRRPSSVVVNSRLGSLGTGDSAADASLVTNLLSEGEEFGLNGLLPSRALLTPPPLPRQTRRPRRRLKGRSSAPVAPAITNADAKDAELSSSSIHPLYLATGLQPGRFTTADHQGVRDNLDSLLSATASNRRQSLASPGRVRGDGDSATLQRRFADVYELDARGAAAFSERDLSVIAERVAARGDGTMDGLVAANNQHFANFGEVAKAVGNLSGRVQVIESVAVSQINDLATSMGVLQSIVDALSVTVETLATHAATPPTPAPTPSAAPLPAPSVPAPQALAQPPPPTLMDVDAEQTKARSRPHRVRAASAPGSTRLCLRAQGAAHRPRDDDDRSSRARRCATGPTPSARCPALRAHCHAPRCTRGAPCRPIVPATPAAAAGPPQAPHDPRRDVVLDPVTWTRDANGIKMDVTNILKVVIPSSKGVRFRNRRATDAYTILTFETSEIAAWIVASWAQAHRGGYHAVTALHPNA
ncbi:hypothetical protein B0H17DRAFT_1223690 [Mycena rosella]|uniref:Uncharacterized protein n=1 Tax=Mycena rosella TaxID=1033263 RepID=A0AAD7H2Q3_MYCRO|nr:hypothetical protein B0H17DRAFT_1223690 [Mycena rosella]